MTTSKARDARGRRPASHGVRSREHRDYLRTRLADPRAAAELLDAAIETGDAGDIMYALREIALARGGVADVAAATGLSRESLYRTLSRNGNPRLTTLLAVMKATGVRIRVDRIA